MENGVVDDLNFSTTPKVKEEVVEHEVTSSDTVESESDVFFEDSISTPRLTHNDDFKSTSEIEVESFEEASGILSAAENHNDEMQQVLAEDKIEGAVVNHEAIVGETAPEAHRGEEYQNGVYGISSVTENHKDEVQFIAAEDKTDVAAADNKPIVEATDSDAHEGETTTNEEIGEVIMPEEHQNGVYKMEKEADLISSTTENHKDEVQIVSAEKRKVVLADYESIVEATAAPDDHQGETTSDEQISEVIPEELQNGATENHKDKVHFVAEDEIGEVIPGELQNGATENHKDEVHYVAEDMKEVLAKKETTAEDEIGEVIPEEHQNGATENHKEEVHFVAEDKKEVLAKNETKAEDEIGEVLPEEHQNGAYERVNLSDFQVISNAKDDVDIITRERLKIDSTLETSDTPSAPEVDCESSQEPIQNLSTDNNDKMEPIFEEKEEKVVDPTEEADIKPAVVIPPSSQKSTTTYPAGLGRAAPLSEPAPRAVHHSRVNEAQSQNQSVDDGVGEASEEYDETREKLQMIRVKFLRLALRLGQTPHNAVVAQVLYRLGLAEQLRGRSGGRVAAFSFDRASAMAEQLEAGGQEPLDFSCTIMVLGKIGVGKSATINSIFDEIKFGTDAFQLGTKKVEDVVGTVQGIKVRVIDTPGLLPSWTDQQHNVKILRSVKQFMKKTPPDIVLYLDRLDMQSRDLTDLPLLRTITEIFGPSIWFNAIVVLTHAASAPPEGPNGTTTSYDMFVTQRSHSVQQAIRMAAGDMRLMNPVSLVENHCACRTNRSGQRVLPNGQVWKPHLLLLSFASKILTEANALLKLQDGPPGRPFTTRTRSPPLPYLLSSLLQSRPHLKLPEEQFAGDDDDIEEDSSESDNESEFDELPPFKPLARAELAKLAKAQKKAYYDEIEYREKLFMKKQLKEEKMRRKMMKNMAAAKDLPVEEEESEEGAAASVPVAMPDLALPASFDADYPSHRYRCLDSPNQWVVRPVLDTQGWDHDVGYEGVNVERLFVVKKKIPVSLSGQLTKDKKDSTLQMELSSSLKHGEGKATSLGFDMQTLGKDMAYTLRGETRLSNRRRNKFSTGVSATLLGDSLTAGLKLEDKLIVNKRFRMVLSGGAMAGQGDIAYGGSLEATLRDKDHPLGRFLSTLGLSVMDWHGDLAIGGNLQSQIPIGRYTNLIARGNLNNRGSGNVSIRLNSSEQLQIALIAVIPLISKLVGYPQQLQYGQ
ncbi:translocase of chloroplast 120, chloroplastic-like [Impatiens glandulifera]|uniref:translocase of chloroplast 120, chloroplastic-like n=1 Tax=Impatiens glandulifera TaxID=253017 RepID=UPI001FB10A96|nr:translocase of chloroplast 120, chloroplastic-like [Impatiens glandulifera]